MLVKAPDFRTHLRFVELCLTHLQLFALQRLAALYDPSSPLLRPNLIRMFKSPCRRLHSTSLLNSFNTDLADTVDEFIVPTEETIQMFLLVLLYLNKRQSTIHTYDPSLMDRIQITQENDELHVMGALRLKTAYKNSLKTETLDDSLRIFVNGPSLSEFDPTTAIDKC
uniref:Uncharacterized protein n=1 Tax=Timema douglasi TaxID=61478 RepID=A0A7R8VU11_TIMDO|nr:unnamed protein product [Timema douglasi]